MNMMMKKTALAVALGLALGLAACGGGGGDGGATSGAAPAPAPAPAPQDLCSNIDGMQTSPLDSSIALKGDGTCTIYGADPKAAKIFEQHGMKKEAWLQLDLVNAEYALERNIKGQGEFIYMLDDGVMATHEQFARRIIGPHVNSLSCPEKGEHGTQVASFAMGATVGVAPLALLYPADKCNWQNWAYPPLEVAIDNRSYTIGPHNLSFSNYPYLIPVQAAGNEGVPFDQFFGGEVLNQPQYIVNDPDWSARTLLVGMTLVDDPDVEGLGNFPGETPRIQAMFVTAPACRGIAAINTGGYATSCGTSMSTPMVSGALALLRQAKPGLSPEQYRDVILKSANKSFSKAYQDNTCGKNKNTNCGLYYFGQGMLDIEAALKMVGVN